MLQFPPSTTPPPSSSGRPPYAVFSISGRECMGQLPKHIPLGLVTHYMPKLKRWVLPEPDATSLGALRLSLTTPYVGINILADIEAGALAWIIARILELGKRPVDKRWFYFDPSLHLSMDIHNAWVALDLPLSGLSGLHVHMQMQLMYGPPIVFLEMKALWAMFPAGSPVLVAMANNFVQAHLLKAYTQSEFSVIRNWYLKDRERCRFFVPFERLNPAFGNIQDELIAEIMADKARADKEALSHRGKKNMGKRGDESLRSEETNPYDSKHEEREKRRQERRNAALSQSYSQPVDSLALMEKMAAAQQQTTRGNDQT